MYNDAFEAKSAKDVQNMFWVKMPPRQQVDWLFETDPGELISARRVLAFVIDLYFFSRRILKYNLFSFVKYNIKLLTAKSGTSLV